jgi:restriction endonuclease Mrr
LSKFARNLGSQIVGPGVQVEPSGTSDEASKVAGSFGNMLMLVRGTFAAQLREHFGVFWFLSTFFY